MKNFIKKYWWVFLILPLLLLIIAPIMFSFLFFMMFSGAKMQANDAKRLSDINFLRSALFLYYEDNKSYPTSLNELLAGKYVPVLPVDPQTGQQYEYHLENANQYFEVCAFVEKTKTKQCETNVIVD
jgi:hypothetical protein